jgi:hypothetical protein
MSFEVEYNSEFMPDNSDRSKGLVGPYVKTTRAVLLIYILNMVWVVLDYQIVQDRNLQNSKI